MLIFPSVFGAYTDIPYKIFEDAHIEYVKSDMHPESESDLISCLQGFDGTILGLEHITRRVMESCPQLKAVAKYGVGLDNVDCAAAKELGIQVVNTPGANADSVADLTFGMMIDLARSISVGNRDLKSGKWKRYKGYSVGGATIGIIGMGAIGKCLARRAKGFEMKILGYDIFWDEAFAKEYGVQKSTLEEIYRESDFISVHVSLDETTRDMISTKEFKMMKSTAIVINCARGGIVNEKDLYTAVKDGIIAGVGLDAYCEEPLPADSPLLTLDNIIVAPHMGASAVSAANNMSIMSAQNIVTALNAG